MLRRYLSVYWKNLIVLILIIGFAIASTVTKGKTSITLSVVAGILMIYAGISFFIWIIKTPAKKSKDEAA